MIKIILIIIVIGIATSAFAAWLPLTKQASGPPPACLNSLVFSDGCNSQYIPVI